MSAKTRFIKVIIPLKIEWEPVYELPEGVECAEGDRVRVSFSGREYPTVVSQINVVPEEEGVPLKSIKKIIVPTEADAGLPRITPEEIRFWRTLSDYYLCTTGEVFKCAYPVEKTDSEKTRQRENERIAKRMEKLRDMIERSRKEQTRERYIQELARLESFSQDAARPDTAERQYRLPTLSKVQNKALEEIKDGFKNHKTTLLDGVTGSGKTEIYITLAAETLSQGKSVLYLVPEIALSRQLEDRLRQFFPDLQTYHSAKTKAGRTAVAANVRSGRSHIILGTRSALFLPFKNLGLVIVDEEHDRSYKQDSPAPRYHARESAIFLAGIHGANVLLGSATPSMESKYNSATDLFRKVELKERFYKGAEPETIVIDTIAERRKNGMSGNFSLKLISYIKAALQNGEQVLLLRARRSFAPAVQCQDCGHVIKCPRCNVTMSLHRNPDRLICHYCGRTTPYSGICPKCGGSMIPIGAGTQRIEEETKAIFPDARVGRLDSDNASKAKEIIESFASGEMDILVGTQMITKGFDFPNLSLVAIVQADNILAVNDFRADEHATQLLEQFRGRSGRREKPGTLVIQTREPDHPVFSAGENILEERKRFGYPPYTRLITITIRDRSESRLKFMASLLAGNLGRSLPEGTLTGPYEPAKPWADDEKQLEIRIALPRDRELKKRKESIRESVLQVEKERKYPGHISIDVDPA